MTQRIRPTLFALGTASTLFSLLMIGLFLLICGACTRARSLRSYVTRYEP